MAGVLVWSSLSSLKAKQYPISAPKVAEIVSQVDVILKEVVSEKNEIFGLFASELHSTLQHVLEQASPVTSSKARQALWANYHKARLPQVWNKFISDMSLPFRNVILEQMVNDKVFEEIIAFTCEAVQRSRQSIATSKPQLTETELSIIRYASGFVPHKLIKRFCKRKEDKYGTFVDCLLNMSYEDCTEEFCDYTKRWTDKNSEQRRFI